MSYSTTNLTYFQSTEVYSIWGKFLVGDLSRGEKKEDGLCDIEALPWLRPPSLTKSTHQKEEVLPFTSVAISLIRSACFFWCLKKPYTNVKPIIQFCINYSFLIRCVPMGQPHGCSPSKRDTGECSSPSKPSGDQACSAVSPPTYFKCRNPPFPFLIVHISLKHTKEPSLQS